MALDLNQSRTSRPWDGRSSRKGSWFTLAAPVLPLNFQKLTMVGPLTVLGASIYGQGNRMSAYFFELYV
jgi:hypothetical protein